MSKPKYKKGRKAMEPQSSRSKRQEQIMSKDNIYNPYCIVNLYTVEGTGSILLCKDCIIESCPCKKAKAISEKERKELIESLKGEWKQ